MEDLVHLTTKTTAFTGACDSSLVVFDPTSTTELLKLTKGKFIFRGKEIDDAGEAHKAFVDAFNLLTSGSKSVLKSEVARLLGSALGLVDQHTEDHSKLMRDSRYKELCAAYNNFMDLK